MGVCGVACTLQASSFHKDFYHIFPNLSTQPLKSLFEITLSMLHSPYVLLCLYKDTNQYHWKMNWLYSLYWNSSTHYNKTECTNSEYILQPEFTAQSCKYLLYYHWNEAELVLLFSQKPNLQFRYFLTHEFNFKSTRESFVEYDDDRSWHSQSELCLRIFQCRVSIFSMIYLYTPVLYAAIVLVHIL